MQAHATQLPSLSTETTAAPATPKGRLWTGRVLSGIAALFLLFDAVGKLLMVQPVIDGTQELGWPVSTIFTIGVLVLIGTVLYLIPRTAILGAIYLTGFLGGAVATHLRIGNPLFSHILFPTYVAALLWGGLALRSPRVRELLTTRI